MPRDIAKLIRQSRLKLQNPYAYLNGEGQYESPVRESAATASIDIARVLKGRSRGRPFTRLEIARIVRNLHTEMWHCRAELFPSRDDVEPMEFLDPELALRGIGYDVIMRESLGQLAAGKESFEVAGIIDKTNATVEISRRSSPVMRNFTMAHELAHAVLHAGSGLHRDRGLDGESLGLREPQEVEADIFASHFLVPEKQLRAAFKKRFLTEQFKPTEATAFALASVSLKLLRARCRCERDLARMLATAQHYNGSHFRSLAERFGVSAEVMAIRLEESSLLAIR